MDFNTELIFKILWSKKCPTFVCFSLQKNISQSITFFFVPIQLLFSSVEEHFDPEAAPWINWLVLFGFLAWAVSWWLITHIDRLYYKQRLDFMQCGFFLYHPAVVMFTIPLQGFFLPDLQNKDTTHHQEVFQRWRFTSCGGRPRRGQTVGTRGPQTGRVMAENLGSFRRREGGEDFQWKSAK